MEINRFGQVDIAEATTLADIIWQEEYSDYSSIFAKTMAEYIIRSGFLNPNISFKITENGIMKGCILASKKFDKGNDYETWLFEQYPQMTEKELQRAKAMHQYFDHIAKRTKIKMQDNDLYLALFISNKAGCGKFLMQKILDICKTNNLKSIYLWTDSSCNHTYYDNNDYILVEEFDNLHLQNAYSNYTSYIYKKPIL